MLLLGAAVRDALNNCTQIPATNIPHSSFLQVWQRWETEAVLLHGSGVRDASRDAAGMAALRRIEEAEPVVHFADSSGASGFAVHGCAQSSILHTVSCGSKELRAHCHQGLARVRQLIQGFGSCARRAAGAGGGAGGGSRGGARRGAGGSGGCLVAGAGFRVYPKPFSSPHSCFAKTRKSPKQGSLRLQCHVTFDASLRAVPLNRIS